MNVKLNLLCITTTIQPTSEVVLILLDLLVPVASLKWHVLYLKVPRSSIVHRIYVIWRRQGAGEGMGETL